MNEMVPVAAQPASDSGALMAIISRAATDPTLDVAKLEKLLAIRAEWQAQEARQAFHSAFAAFKAEAVRIVKNKLVTDGPLKSKRYADLFAVVDAVSPALAAHGLSASWKITRDEKDWIEVACILSHVAGHSEQRTMGGPPDSGGAKNAIQARASAVSYLERYTLLAALGMTAADQDHDGRKPSDEPAADPWTPELRAAGKAAAERGTQAYADWWKGLHAEFRRVATKTQQHADYKALAEESQP